MAVEEIWSPKKMDNFLKLCRDLKSYVSKMLDTLDQTDYVNDLRHRIDNATIWNDIFDISILAMAELVKQLEEKEIKEIKRDKGDIKHGKE